MNTANHRLSEIGGFLLRSDAKLERFVESQARLEHGLAELGSQVKSQWYVFVTPLGISIGALIFILGLGVGAILFTRTRSSSADLPPAYNEL